MPTVLTERGISFRFYASDMGEPPHIHAVRGRNRAKIWLADLTLVYNRGFNQSEIRSIFDIVEQHQTLMMEAWNGFFS